MANKKFWLGMLVIVLVFGMTVIGCDNGLVERENEWRFRNQSSHTIVVDIGAGGLSPSYFELAPGEQQIVRSESRIYGILFLWFRKDTGNQTGIHIVQDFERTTTFRNN